MTFQTIEIATRLEIYGRKVAIFIAAFPYTKS
jgi:hypothetical protein